MFLPYHRHWITGWQWGMGIIDPLLVWTPWPAYLHEWDLRLLSRWRLSRAMVTIAMMALGVLAFSLVVASYPGEAAHNERLAQSENVLWPYYNRPYLPNTDFSDDALLQDGNFTRMIGADTSFSGAKQYLGIFIPGSILHLADPTPVA